jgi:hypothetical protein
MLQESCSKTRGLAEQYVANSPASLDHLPRSASRAAAEKPRQGWITRMEAALDSLSRELFRSLLGEQRLERRLDR